MSLGIQNTKEVLLAITAGYDSLGTVLAGGKIKPLAAVMALMDLQDEIASAIKDAESIPAELKDIDESELAEIGALALPLVKKIVAAAKGLKKVSK